MVFQPDEQLNDWYGWLTVQCGHSVIGQAGAFILLPFFGAYLAPVMVGLVYLVAWEWAVQRFRAGIGDGLTDTACTMAGASVLCGMTVGYGTAAICFAAWAALLLFGVLRRA